MSETGEPANRGRLDSLFDALADGHRRQVLRTLLDATPEPVDERTLATAIAARTHGCPAGEVTDAQRLQATVSLRHADLPKLEAAGLIERTADRQWIARVDHPVYEDEGVRAVLEGEVAASAESLDARFAALGDDRRRTILEVLDERLGPIDVETIAREIGADDLDAAASAVPDRTVGAIIVSLRHLHLQRLAGAGLVEYEPDTGTVACVGRAPSCDVPENSVLSPHFWVGLPDEPGEEEEGVETVPGR